MKDHRRIDERSLAFGRAIAARLPGQVELIEQAQVTIGRWLETCSPSLRPALLEWAAALAGPLDGVVWLLTSVDERATRLRQSNPFAGVLSPHERTQILRKFQSYDAAST